MQLFTSLFTLLLITLNFLLMPQTLAQNVSNSSNKPHQQHSYQGSHGMALLPQANGELLAYHMALYAKPHDFQLLYQIELDAAQKQHIQAGQFLTLLPDNFDLRILIDGEQLVIGADLYAGHFERGGKKIARLNKVTFKKQYYKHPLPAHPASPQHASHTNVTELYFDLVKLSGDVTLAVHRIDTRPSFDAIVALENALESTLNANFDKATPRSDDKHTLVSCADITNTTQQSEPLARQFDRSIITQLTEHCFSQAPVYAEFSDFR